MTLPDTAVPVALAPTDDRACAAWLAHATGASLGQRRTARATAARWATATAEERSAHARMMLAARRARQCPREGEQR